ncbi:Hypothetical predicted protein [Xyrichtys novacula]|uniref:Uncharacterized protein n=1 Tax=Xyrichtys novacula TaxID=13765 RepID=A0AAV1GPI4_XYRNO|nr:Hypothetical predicted protein [Xyrichtys novacula]
MISKLQERDGGSVRSCGLCQQPSYIREGQEDGPQVESDSFSFCLFFLKFSGCSGRPCTGCSASLRHRFDPTNVSLNLNPSALTSLKPFSATLKHLSSQTQRKL